MPGNSSLLAGTGQDAKCGEYSKSPVLVCLSNVSPEATWLPFGMRRVDWEKHPIPFNSMEPVGHAMLNPHPALHSNRSHFSVIPATPLAAACLAAPFQSLSISRKMHKASPPQKKSPFHVQHCQHCHIRPQSGKAAPQARSVSKLVKLRNGVCPLCVHVF